MAARQPFPEPAALITFTRWWTTASLRSRHHRDTKLHTLLTGALTFMIPFFTGALTFLTPFTTGAATGLRDLANIALSAFAVSLANAVPVTFAAARACFSTVVKRPINARLAAWRVAARDMGAMVKRQGIEKRFEAEISMVSNPFDTKHEIREFKNVCNKNK